MTTFDNYWWFDKHFDEIDWIWQRLIIIDDLTKILMKLMNMTTFLIINDDMTTFDNYWWFDKDFDEIDWIWQRLIINDDLTKILMKLIEYDNVW